MRLNKKIIGQRFLIRFKNEPFDGKPFEITIREISRCYRFIKFGNEWYGRDEIIFLARLNPAPLPPPLPNPLDMENQIQTIKMEFIKNPAKKIEAIKKVREITRLGLKEAKDLVDSWHFLTT